jgi:hypothetical protein
VSRFALLMTLGFALIMARWFVPEPYDGWQMFCAFVGGFAWGWALKGAKEVA